MYFKNGWQAFVDYHCLKYGDFLVFRYDGGFTFDVKIFGKNGCKKAVVAEADNSVPILDSVLAVAGMSPPILKVKVEAVDEKEEVKPLISGKRKLLQVGSGENFSVCPTQLRAWFVVFWFLLITCLYFSVLRKQVLLVMSSLSSFSFFETCNKVISKI